MVNKETQLQQKQFEEFLKFLREQPRAIIISVVSQKGGVGKTGLDCQMAIFFAQLGFKTCVVDMDETQYSAAKLLTRRRNSNILPEVPFKIATTDTLKSVISKIAKDFDIIFIESTGKITSELKAAISLGDIILSPLEAVGDNIDTAPNLENTIDEFVKKGIIKKSIPAFIIPNKIPSQQREKINFDNTENKLVELHNTASEFKYFKVTHSFIKHRPSIYPKCYDLGKGINELTWKDIKAKEPEKGKKAIETAYNEFKKLIIEITGVFYE